MKKVILIYLVIFILFSVIFLYSFNTALFNQQKVLFYRGLMLLITTTVVLSTLILLYYFRISKKNTESLLAALTISIAFHLGFFVVFPVTFERSLTMYLLNTLGKSASESCQGLTKLEMENKLINEYIIKQNAVQKRIEEQKIINFINDRNNCIGLTNKGIKFLKISQIIGNIYGLK